MSMEEPIQNFDKLAHISTRERKYNVYISIGCTHLDNALHYLRLVLQEAHKFDTDALHFTTKDCTVIVMFRELIEHALICYQSEIVSVILIDVQFNEYLADIIKLLNTATLTCWEPLELNVHLVAAFLIVYMDGELRARIKFTSQPDLLCRIKLEIENQFVDNALLDTPRDRHLTEGIERVEEAIVQAMQIVHLSVQPLKRFKILEKLVISSDGSLRAGNAENLLEITKFISYAVQRSIKCPPLKT